MATPPICIVIRPTHIERYSTASERNDASWTARPRRGPSGTKRRQVGRGNVRKALKEKNPPIGWQAGRGVSAGMATSRPARARTTQPPGRQARTHRAATLENARSAQLRERPKTQEGRPPERGVDKEGEQGPGARTRGGRPREGAGPQARGVSMRPLPPDGGQRRKHTLPARGEHRDEAGRTPQRNKSGSMMDQPLKDPAPDGQRRTTAGSCRLLFKNN